MADDDRLAQFRAKVKQRTVRYASTEDDLFARCRENFGSFIEEVQRLGSEQARDPFRHVSWITERSDILAVEWNLYLWMGHGENRRYLNVILTPEVAQITEEKSGNGVGRPDGIYGPDEADEMTAATVAYVREFFKRYGPLPD